MRLIITILAATFIDLGQSINFTTTHTPYYPNGSYCTSERDIIYQGYSTDRSLQCYCVTQLRDWLAEPSPPTRTVERTIGVGATTQTLITSGSTITSTLANVQIFTYLVSENGDYAENFNYYGSATSPCCSSCTVAAQTVELYYFPTPAVASAATSFISNGYTFLSPSVYIGFTSLYAFDFCGNVGNSYTSTTLEFHPDEISTLGVPVSYTQVIETYTEGTISSISTKSTTIWSTVTTTIAISHGVPDLIDFRDLGPNCTTALPEGYTYLASEPYSQLLPYDPCHPVIVLPTRLKTMVDPAWASCANNGLGGFYDPPSALTHLSAIGSAPSNTIINTVSFQTPESIVKGSSTTSPPTSSKQAAPASTPDSPIANPTNTLTSVPHSTILSPVVVSESTITFPASSSTLTTAADPASPAYPSPADPIQSTTPVPSMNLGSPTALASESQAAPTQPASSSQSPPPSPVNSILSTPSVASLITANVPVPPINPAKSTTTLPSPGVSSSSILNSPSPGPQSPTSKIQSTPSISPIPILIPSTLQPGSALTTNNIVFSIPLIPNTQSPDNQPRPTPIAIIDSQTLLPGGPAITASNTIYTLPSSGSSILASPLLPSSALIAVPSTLRPDSPITTNNIVFSLPPSSPNQPPPTPIAVIASQTLTPGGPAINASDIVYSLPTGSGASIVASVVSNAPTSLEPALGSIILSIIGGGGGETVTATGSVKNGGNGATTVLPSAVVASGSVSTTGRSWLGIYITVAVSCMGFMGVW